MKEFASHKKLRGKKSQEGLRFLQFYGQKPVEFRKFIFAIYIKQFIFLAINILTFVLFILSFFYFSYNGVLIAGISYGVLFAIYKIGQLLIAKFVQIKRKDEVES
jgi:hypothetical protein